MREHVSDPYVKRAQKEGYRSRAAYKLLEIDSRDRLLRPGMTVVDLGAAPGGWSQVVAQKVGPKGKVVAVDILDMGPVPGVAFLKGDVREPEVLARLGMLLAGAPLDLVISDMAPHISGVDATDQARSLELAQLALAFSRKFLKPGGSLLVKMFQGEGWDEFAQAMGGLFRRVVIRKPRASRSRSNEIYLLGRDRIGEASRV